MREEGLPKKATCVQRPKAGNKGNYVKVWGAECPGRESSPCKGPEAEMGGLEGPSWPTHNLLLLPFCSPGLQEVLGRPPGPHSLFLQEQQGLPGKDANEGSRAGPSLTPGTKQRVWVAWPNQGV